MDLSGAILMLSSGTYDAFRRVPEIPEYVRGVRQPSVTTTFTITASVQPASGLVVSRLPEGKRNRETMVVYTTVELVTAQLSNEPDLIHIDGGSFEVESCQRWDKLGNYWEAVVTRVPGT